MDLALLQAGFPVVIIAPILRAEHFTAIERGRARAERPEPFYGFIAGRVVEAMQERLRLMRTWPFLRALSPPRERRPPPEDRDIEGVAEAHPAEDGRESGAGDEADRGLADPGPQTQPPPPSQENRLAASDSGALHRPASSSRSDAKFSKELSRQERAVGTGIHEERDRVPVTVPPRPEVDDRHRTVDEAEDPGRTGLERERHPSSHRTSVSAAGMSTRRGILPGRVRMIRARMRLASRPARAA